jgi:hypothetical protein
MTSTGTTPRRAAVRLLLALVAIVVAGGVFLPWASNPQGSIAVGVGSLDQRLSAFGWIPGWVALSGAALILLAALIVRTRLARSLAALGGRVALAPATWALVSARSFYLTVASFTLSGGEFSRTDVRTQVERILDDFDLAVHPGVGAWMVAGGGLLAIIVAIFLRSPKQLEAPRDTHAPQPSIETDADELGTKSDQSGEAPDSTSEAPEPSRGEGGAITKASPNDVEDWR